MAQSNKVDLAEKFDLFTEYCSPKIVGELNGQQMKLVKFQGEFIWHKHDNEDELFFVVDGLLAKDGIQRPDGYHSKKRIPDCTKRNRT